MSETSLEFPGTSFPILKQVKGSGGGDARPTSSVVRTISD